MLVNSGDVQSIAELVVLVNSGDVLVSYGDVPVNNGDVPVNNGDALYKDWYDKLSFPFDIQNQGIFMTRSVSV